ncbi:MAG: glycosyltransferase family 2 protein [Actinobacteria bacterium]|nr:glycosyltransferase family 2 protein [Actinomycetota bacterium]
MTTVSVIMPTYNRAATVIRAVESVLNQTFADIELIVVDDGSTDSTPALMENITDPRLRYIRLPTNGGVARARNAGIAVAGSDWLAFQDSDDEWLPGKLESQLAAARDAPNDADWVIGGYTLDSSDGETVIPQHTLAGADPTPDILDGWPIITPTWLVRRELLAAVGPFDESMRCLEDWDLAFRLSAASSPRAVAGPILVKHGSIDSVFSSLEDVESGLATILSRHGDRWRGNPQRLSRRLAHLGCVEYKLGHRRQAMRTLARAVAKNPTRLPLYGLLAAALSGPGALHRAEARWPWDAGMTLPPGRS